MTASYDGRLVVTAKRVEPCCETLCEALYLKAVYKGTAKPVLKLRVAEGLAREVRFCPFCGATAEARR